MVHGRLRFSLGASSADDRSQPYSAFSNALPEDLTPAAAQEKEAAAWTPTNTAVLNVCEPTEPHVELELQASVINAIGSAYSSSGYPSVMTTGSTRGAVYGSFVDLRNPSVHTLSLPPAATVVVAPSSGSRSRNGQCVMETLVKVVWCRSAGMMVPAADHKAAGGGRRSGSDPSQSAGTTPVDHAGAAANGLKRPTFLQQHLQQFPDGIHGKQSSPQLRNLILRGEYPTTAEEAAMFPIAAPAAAPNPSAASTGTAAGSSAPAAASPANAMANTPQPGIPPEGTAPVQHTLVSANTYNHLSVYFVAHQGGRFLYSAPVQTLSASISTRKITAHHLFMIGREEVDPIDNANGYELQFSSGGSSSVASTPSSLANSSRKVSGRVSVSGGNSLGKSGLSASARASPDCIDGRRRRISLRPLSVSEEAGDTFFGSDDTLFVGADPRKRTIHAALVGFKVEPLLLIGNQNGDLFIHSILEERIVQRLNYNGGLSVVSSSLSGAANSCSGGGKVVTSAVSCIAEVTNGLEKKLSVLTESVMTAKANGCDSFSLDESVNAPVSVEGAASKSSSSSYYSLSPSLFAVGFDSGEVLLLCITSEGGWLLKHFGNSSFGHRPIQAIAPRVPSLFTRLWACYTAAPNAKTATKNSSGSSSSVVVAHRTLISPASALIGAKEDQRMAAISCHGGCVVLVRLPGLEVVSSVSVYDYNAVGEILTLAWSASSAAMLLTPDTLFASGEDDTVNAFQLVFAPAPLNSGDGGLHTNASLCILERKRFHRSWVNSMSVLPLALSAARAGPGMPQFLGTCLLATSYDNRTSFWPMLFGNGNGNGNAEDGVSQPPQRQFLLVDGPTAAYRLHNELVVGTAVGGGGTSYFVVSVCCRGRVRFWSCSVITE